MSPPYVGSPALVHREQLPESAYMHQLLGLNLLFLLSQNRVAEFHTELERLPAKDIQTNVYIKHPVSLEQVRLGNCPGVGGRSEGGGIGTDIREDFLEEGAGVTRLLAGGLICSFVQQLLSSSRVP